jgi:cytochrome P450
MEEERMRRATGLPPGPKLPPIFQWAHWIRNPRGFLSACGAHYGHTFTVRFPGRPAAVWFAEPAAAKSMFATDRESFEVRAGTAGNVFSAFVGEGSLLLMVGARHRQERRLLDPPFHGQHLSSFDGPISELTDRAIDNLPIGRAFPLYPVLEDLSTSINLRCLLGITDDERCERLKRLLTHYLEALTPPPLSRITAAAGLRLLLLRRRNTGQTLMDLKTEIYILLGQEIERCRQQGPEGSGEILARLVAARDEDSETTSEATTRVCDQLFTFLIAGHRTTATSLSWALAHILKRREIEERLHQELRQSFGDGAASPVRNSELRYLDAVIKETLRLYPPFLIVTRRVLKTTSLQGYELPAGTPVAISTYLLHRRPDLWDNPGEFRPERFLESRPSPFEYCPFGGGQRMCIANSFAMHVSAGVLARVLSRVSLRMSQGGRIRPELWQAFAAPQGGPPVIVDEVARANPQQGRPGMSQPANPDFSP